MFKDLILAIILGALLGFGATGGFFALTKNKTNPVAKTVSQNVTPTPSADDSSSSSPTPSPAGNLSETSSSDLTVETPKNESVVTNSKIEIKGTATPKSIIIVKTPVKSYTLTSDAKGAFLGEIEVESGANIISVSSIDSNDTQTDVQLLVTYSTTKF